MQKSEYKNIGEEYRLKAEEIFKIFSDFSDGYRVMFLIQRHKDGGHTNNSKLRMYITRNPEEWKEALAKLLQERDQYPEIALRIYQTINPRNIDKSIRTFKQMQLDNDYYDMESKNNFYIDIKNRWVSAMMKKNTKMNTQFLVDIDSSDAAFVSSVEAEIRKHTEVSLLYPTVQGWHIIVKPFNHTLFPKMENVEIKTDAMMLLDY